LEAVVGVADERRDVVGQDDSALLRRPFQDSWIVRGEEAGVLDSDDVEIRLSSLESLRIGIGSVARACDIG